MIEAATTLLSSINDQWEPSIIHGVSSNETQPLSVEDITAGEPVRQCTESSTAVIVDYDTIQWHWLLNDLRDIRLPNRLWRQWGQGISRGERLLGSNGILFFQYLIEGQWTIDLDTAGVEGARVASEALLKSILADLWSLPEEAREEGILVPPKKLLQSVERLLRAMFDILPRQFELYATADAVVDIDVPNLRGSSVIVSCDKGGGALCTVHIRGEYQSREYENLNLLPDAFLTESLQELAN